jgi:hypothetical protein
MRKRLTRLAAAIAAAAALLPGTPAAAATPGCATGPTSKAFSRFGDLGDYFLAPNGGFEQALTWSRSGSVSRVAGSEPFNLAGAGHSSSLRLLKDGSVTTPMLCVSPELPHLRFVAKSSGSGQLDVEVRFYENGKVTDSSSGSISPSDHALWAPSRAVLLKVDKLKPGQTGSVTVTFKSQGDWLVDDVFVDPLKRG